MNTYRIDVTFNVKAENENHAKHIIEYEIQKNIPFKGVPYSWADSGIIEFGVLLDKAQEK